MVDHGFTEKFCAAGCDAAGAVTSKDLDDWLRAQRRAHPDTKVEVLQLPAGDPPAGVVAQLVDELSSGTREQLFLAIPNQEFLFR